MKISIPKVRFVRYDYSEINVIPKKYSKYLTDMNYLYASGSADVFRGRDKEINRIFNTFLKTRNTNVVLLGDNGVGKSCTVQAAVHKVLKKKCPKELRYHHFIYLDIEKMLIASQVSKTQSNKENIGEVFDFLTSYSNLIVVIDQIHLIANSRPLLYLLSILLKISNVKVIGMSTEEDFYTYFMYETKILSMFDVIPILEPKPRKIYTMISEYLKVLENAHGVTISKDLVEYIVSVSSAFSSDISNPGLAVNFIEKSMIVAKRHKHKEVTKGDINTNFNFDYELYNKMSPEDKTITAYHEAGHFIVSKMSEHIKNYKTTAITIVPAENFLGVTMFEFEPEKQTSCDSDYFIDNIATDLAGRVAEMILKGNSRKAKLTSGAYADLKNATQTARNIITEFGMIENCGHNMTYFCNYDLSDLALLSEERKKMIDHETKKLIEEAFNRANKILNENRELLDLIAQELLSNEVLDEKDLDRLCNQVSNATK